jgi:hypothetical protein
MNPKPDDLDDLDITDEELDRAEAAEQYKRSCASRRSNGLALLGLAGLFFYSATNVSRKAQSSAEVFGAFSVPVVVLAVAAYYLLTKPKMK